MTMITTERWFRRNAHYHILYNNIASAVGLCKSTFQNASHAEYCSKQVRNEFEPITINSAAIHAWYPFG